MSKQKHVTWKEAKESADRLMAMIQRSLAGRAEFAGSLRRKCESVGDLDLLYEGDIDDITTIKGVQKLRGGKERLHCQWEGRQLDVWRVHPGTWGSMLFAVTGPTQYFIWYAKIAISKGMKLSGKGLYRGNELIAAETELDIYRALQKEWKDPTQRGL